jgi:hypothetical protein
MSGCQPGKEHPGNAERNRADAQAPEGIAAGDHGEENQDRVFGSEPGERFHCRPLSLSRDR